MQRILTFIWLIMLLAMSEMFYLLLHHSEITVSHIFFHSIKKEKIFFSERRNNLRRRYTEKYKRSTMQKKKCKYNTWSNVSHCTLRGEKKMKKKNRFPFSSVSYPFTYLFLQYRFFDNFFFSLPKSNSKLSFGLRLPSVCHYDCVCC